VLFDNRDIGRSPHGGGAPPTARQLLTRSRGAAHYTLADMADDASGLLHKLELSPAHVIGASMGGMIAQTLAIRHPRQVSSLVSMMSNTGSRRAGQPALRMYPLLLRRPARGREAAIEHTARLFAAIGSTGLPQDTAAVRELAAVSYDRDHDRTGPGRQLAAIIASGERTAELRRIDTPTLVVHGTADRLVSPSGGRATARAIRGANLLMIDGMGHDMPTTIWPRLLDAITQNVARAGLRVEQPA
jgi:pimeloyl-ACP methyl ester carboxylesterase